MLFTDLILVGFVCKTDTVDELSAGKYLLIEDMKMESLGEKK